MTETRGVFAVSKCTLCGCGEKTVKAFHLQEQPRPSSAKRHMESGEGKQNIPSLPPFDAPPRISTHS